MKNLYGEMMQHTSPYRAWSLWVARRHGSTVVIAMRLGPAQLVVGHVCVHDHLVMFEQSQTVTITSMSGHELDTHSIDTVTVAGHRMSYHEYVPGAYYGLKDRAPQKRYLVTVLGLRLLCVWYLL
jgi:hypothetical protein